MKKTLLLLTASLLACSTLHAAKKEEQPSAEATPAEVADERKPSMFERLFRKREPKPEAPAAEPEPTVKRGVPMEELTKKAIPTENSETERTPSPTPKPRKKRSRPKPEATPAEEETPEPEKEAAKPTATPEPEETAEPTATPSPEEKSESASLQEPVPFVPTPEPEKPKKEEGPDILDPDYEKKMRAKYEGVQAKALEDKKVAELKETADGAFDPDERTKALRAYYKALFERMREVDSSMKARIDSREKATLRRLDLLSSGNE